MSGVYHMLPEDSTGRAVMGRLDKAAIFVLPVRLPLEIHACVPSP